MVLLLLADLACLKFTGSTLPQSSFVPTSLFPFLGQVGIGRCIGFLTLTGPLCLCGGLGRPSASRRLSDGAGAETLRNSLLLDRLAALLAPLGSLCDADCMGSSPLLLWHLCLRRKGLGQS